MKLVLPVLLFFITSHSFAQSIESFWSESIVKSENEIPANIFPTVDSGYAVVKRFIDDEKTVSISILDSNNNLVNSNKLTLQCDEIINVSLVNYKITLFTVQHNDAEKEDVLNVQTLNAKGELSSTKQIANIKSNGGYLAKYKIAVSQDGQKVGVMCEHPYYKEKNEELLLIILGKDLEPLIQKDYSYSFQSRKRRFNVPVINNNGTMYILKRFREKASNSYFLTMMKESGVEEHHPLKLRSMKIADVSSNFTKEGSLIVSGFYAGYASLNFEGTFSIKYDESTIPVYRKEYMLPETLIEGLKSKKEISKFGAGLDKYHIKEVVVMPNGVSYLVAEHTDVVKTESEYIESRKGIAIVKFSDKGDFLWAAPIEINQVDENDKGYWNSSILVGGNEKFRVLYNGIGEGLKKVEDVYGKNAVHSLKMVEIGENGNVETIDLKGFYESLPEPFILNSTPVYYDYNKLMVIVENKAKNNFHLGALKIIEKE